MNPVHKLCAWVLVVSVLLVMGLPVLLVRRFGLNENLASEFCLMLMVGATFTDALLCGAAPELVEWWAKKRAAPIPETARRNRQLIPVNRTRWRLMFRGAPPTRTRQTRS
jgi:hypothetical protein